MGTGYHKELEFSENDGVFYGSVMGVRALISYEGTSAKEFIDDFHGAVDDYLELCRAEGKEPEKYNEIVVDKSFLNSIGMECGIGEKLSLNTENGPEEFVVRGYTGREQELSSYTVYVSEEFAEKNPAMRVVEYTALVRIAGAQDMESSGFESAVYQIAEDYGVKR